MHTITLISLVTLGQVIFGSLWYGPMLFGRIWARINGIDMAKLSKEEIKNLQKGMFAYYLLQIALSVISNIVLFQFIRTIPDFDPVKIAEIIWLGFIMPVQAGEVIWNNLHYKLKMHKFFISSMYQLISIMATAYIFGMYI